MRSRKFVPSVLTIPLLFAVPGAAGAQPVQAPSAAEAQAALHPPTARAAYSPAQLDQMLAPIALYPDQLLLQVLMAATFPQQVIDAGKWLQDSANAGLAGDQLAAALQPLPWDPSVKSLVAFPQIIVIMNEHLDWTEALGAAFAGQQVAVMARVQFLRERAANAGRLKSTPQLRIVRQRDVIVIEPAEPGRVYVPVYNPAVVYGAWPDRDAPPVYIPPPRRYYEGEIGAGIAFAAGAAIVAPLWGWSHPDWHRHEVVVDPQRYDRITNTTNITNNRVEIRNDIWHRTAPVVPVPETQRPHPAAAAPTPPGTVGTQAIVRPRGPEHGPEPHPGAVPPAPAEAQHPAPPIAGHAVEAPHPGAAAPSPGQGAHPAAPGHPVEPGHPAPGPAQVTHPVAPAHPGEPPHPAAEVPHPAVAPPHPAVASPHPAEMPHPAAAPPHPAEAPHPAAAPPHPVATPPHPVEPAHPPAAVHPAAPPAPAAAPPHPAAPAQRPAAPKVPSKPGEKEKEQH